MSAQSKPQDELESFDEIYNDSFDDSIEQSAIYRGVLFPCIKQEIVAIVLTPVCDIYLDKADFIRMAGFIPAEWIFEKWLEKQDRVTREQIIGIAPLENETKVKKIHAHFARDCIGHKELRYHLIPSYKDKFPHSFVDFQLVESFSPGDVRGFDKVAVLKSPWKESILARYAAYCGRVGTKVYSEELINAIMGQISHLTWLSQ